MSEMKEMILDVVDRVLKENVDKDLVDILEDGKWAKDLWDIFLENGMTTVAISEKNEGAGGDLDDLLNIVRLTGKYAAPIPFAEVTFANTLLEYVSLKPSDSLVTYMISGNQNFFIEDNRISGAASNIPWARYAEKLLVLVNEVDGPQLVLVELLHADITPSTNLAGEPRDTVVLKNSKIVQVSDILNFEQMHHITKLETAFRLALITGAIEKVNELTVQYTKEREQFGRPIHRFQLVQQHLVQLAGESAVMQAAFNNFTAALLNDSNQNEVAFTCLRAEEAITLAATIGHQVLAAIGTTYEHALQQYTRRLWSWRDEGVHSDYWSDLIATDLLENSGNNLWDYLTRNKGEVKI